MTSSQKASSQVFSDGIVVSNKFIDECKKIFDPIMKEKAENVSVSSWQIVAYACCIVVVKNDTFSLEIANILKNCFEYRNHYVACQYGT